MNFMNDNIFIDTNIIAYIHDNSNSKRQKAAQELFNNYFDKIFLSSQVLGELFNLLIKK